MPLPAILPARSEAPLGVLIVDDSVVARAVLARAVDAVERFHVAGAVSNAAAALQFLKSTRVDVILLDIEMPEVDGLSALPDLIAASHGARVLIVSSSAREGAGATIQALALGAADTLQKPGPGTIGGRFSASLQEKLERLVAEVPLAPGPLAPRLGRGADAFDVVAIGASTGGIHALSQLLREVPASFTAPILITQHLPASFMPFFAAQVAVLADRPCDVATDSLRIRPGRVTVAAGDAHMKCVRLADGGAAVRLLRSAMPSGCMPSVDPMFDSVAEVFGPRALAVVLSGMGRDGSIGAKRVLAAGGCVVVQDKASSVVWGMPGAVAAAGDANEILAPDGIGRLIAQRRRPSC